MEVIARWMYRKSSKVPCLLAKEVDKSSVTFFCRLEIVTGAAEEKNIMEMQSGYKWSGIIRFGTSMNSVTLTWLVMLIVLRVAYSTLTSLTPFGSLRGLMSWPL